MESETGLGDNAASVPFGMERRRQESIPAGAGRAGRTTIPGSPTERRTVAMILGVLSTVAACLRRFRQDARRLPIPAAAPVLAVARPAVGPVAVASPTVYYPPQAETRPVAVAGRGDPERSGCKAGPQRLPATVAVKRRPLRRRIRALSGRIRRAAGLLAAGIWSGIFKRHWNREGRKYVARQGDALRNMAVAFARIVFVATLLGGATMARADVLVSNIGQTQNGTTILLIYDIAQGFTTGDNLSGYTLGSVEIGINSGVISQDRAKPSARIVEGSPTGQLVATLNKPARLSAGTTAVHRYTAPTGTRLSASTTYYVVVEAGTFTSVFALQTNATEEDSASTQGWLINDRGHWRFASGTGSFSQYSSGTNLKIRVNGTAQAADTTAPTVTIGGVPETSTAAFTATFTFSEPVTGFAVGDITLGNGTASAFTTTSTSVYTALIAPTASGTVTVDVAGGAAQDGAGNVSTAATQASSTYTAPALPAVTVSAISRSVSEGDYVGFTLSRTGSTTDALTVAILVESAPGVLDAMPRTSVTFPANDNDSTVSLLLLTTDDEVEGPDREIRMTLVADTADPATYTLGSPSSAVVTVEDNDEASLPEVTVSARSSPVSEGKKFAAFLLMRMGDTAAELVVTVAVTQDGDVLSGTPPTSVTFEAGLVGALLIVPTVDDAVDEDAGAVTVTLVADTADPATYTLGSAASASVTVTDNDTRGVTLSTVSLTVAEGGTGSYTVVLDSAPTGTVTITLSSDNTEVTLSPAALTFTAIDWDMPQTVTVSAGQDADTSDDRASIAHAAAGADYASLSAAAVSLTVTDDDPADTTAPTVTSIERQTPTASPTNADDLTWRVTFGEAVANVDAADFAVSGTTATVTAVTAVSPVTGAWDVTASGGNLGSLDATVTLAFASGHDITDAAGNALASTTPTGANENAFVVDNIAPGVEITGVPETSSEPFTATITFSEGVDGFAVEDIAVGNGTASVFTGSDGDTEFMALITPTADGAVTVDVAADVAADAAGNGNTAAARVSSIYDHTAPTVTSIMRQSPTSSPTNADALTWRVTFSEAMANVDAADFTVSNTSATLTAAAVQGSSLAYDVTASGGHLGSLDATVTLSFVAGQNIADPAGNALANTTPTGANENAFVVDNTAPTVEITGVPSTSTAAFTATFTFSEAVNGFVAGDIAVGNGTASAFTGTDGDTVFGALIAPTAYGAVTVDVATGAAQDEAGNGNTAATQVSSSYTAPAPTAANGTVTTTVDSDYSFSTDDFKFMAANGNPLSSVKIVTLPGTGKGTLKVGAANVSAGDSVSRYRLTHGKLEYVPPSGGGGTGFASFTFKVNDGVSDSADTYTMTIDVTPAPAHCDSSDGNELWCGTMTVDTLASPPLYGYNKYGGFGSITPNTFTHNGKTFVVNGLSHYGKPARSLRFALSRYFDPNYSSDFYECLLSRLGSTKLSLEIGTGESKKTVPLVVDRGSQVHFDSYYYGVNWSKGDTVPVKLLRVASPGAPSQTTPVASAVRSTTSPFDSIEVSWTAVNRVCGTPAEGYEIQVSEDGTNWHTLVASTGSTALTYTHSGLPTGASRHYRVQAVAGPKGNGIGSAFGRSASASTAPAVGSPCGSLPDELWCADMTVGSENNANSVTGFNVNSYGSLVPGQFNYGGPEYSIFEIKQDIVSRTLIFALRPIAGNSIVNTAGFHLHLGTRSYSLPADRTGPGTSTLDWDNIDDPIWSVGDRVIVRLTRPPASANQVEGPTVEGAPAVSEAGADGHWTESETVEVTLAFSEAVTVDTANGVPSVGLGLGGPAATRSAPYLRGGGTAELVFGYTLVAGDGDHTVMAVTPDSLALNGGAIRSVATSADAALGHNGTLVLARPSIPDGPKARFEGLPEQHNGSTAFTVELRFSAEPAGLSYRTVQDGLLEVEGGTVTRAARTTPGSNQDWRVTVAPSGDGDVQIRLPARSCGEPNAVCIGGAPLAQAAEATVPGASSTAPPPEVPLTASFSGAPAEHDGTGPFELQFRLSEAPAGLSYRTVQSGLFDVSGGTIGRTWRLQRGNDTGWGLRIEPSGFGDVTLTVRATTDCAGTPGVCAPDGRMLGGGLQATIAGPATLSVADAEVDEASGVTLDFAVSLSRALTETVTVEYRTADGSASAGADYTNTTGTLTFAAGETSKTVSVPVLDDEHDEGSETMTLRLRNPSPARVKLADGEATGTINNTDAMPQAWLARFGRTVAGHVLDGVAERMAAPRAAGLNATLGGQALPGMGLSGDAAARPSGAQTREAEVRAKALSDWLNGGTRDDGEEARRLGSRTVSGRELVLGSAFSLTGATADGGTAGFWGRAAVSGFDGREGELILDGEVTTGLLGADYGRGRWLLGLIASHSRGEGSYRGSSAGTVSSTLTGVHPWARYALSERLSVWGAAGYGAGTLTLDPEGEGAGKQAMQADLSFAMAAAGARGELLEPPGDAGGPALALVSDAMFVRTESERTRGLAAASADVTRLRLALDGSWRFALAGDAALTPSLELGVRHDGGDAETGFGVDIGGGLAFADPKRGLTFDVSARTLVAHEASGFRERGITAALTFDPRPSTDRGLTMSLRQTLGAASTGGADALMGRETLTGLGANDNGGARRLELTAGYGIAMFGGRFTGTPEIGVGLSDTGRDYSLGWRLGLGSSGGTSFELGLEATRRESASDDAAEHTVGFRLGATW